MVEVGRGAVTLFFEGFVARVCRGRGLADAVVHGDWGRGLDGMGMGKGKLSVLTQRGDRGDGPPALRVLDSYTKIGGKGSED